MELPGNNSIGKTETGKKPITTSTVTKNEASTGNKLLNAIFPNFGKLSADQIIFDVAIPKLKEMLLDIASTALFGTTIKGQSKKNPLSKISYNSMYENNRAILSEPRERQSRIVNPSDELFDTRGEAELVLDTLGYEIERYGKARVTDFYEYIGKTCDYTLERYGWENLRDARVLPYGNKFYIEFPPHRPLR